MLLGYELLLATRWFGYELIRVRLSIEYELVGYELEWVRVRVVKTARFFNRLTLRKKTG